MSDQISWYVELALEPQRLDEYRALTSEMTDAARQEAGILIYERYISDDNRTVFIHERFSGSDAAISHLRLFNTRFAERFHGIIRRKRFVVFGAPTDTLKLLLNAFGAIYMTPLDGFAR